MTTPSWQLRPARAEDHDFLFALNRATMRELVQQVWGWEEDEQVDFFDARFEPGRWHVIEVGGDAVGVLIVQERTDDIYLAEIQVSPEWQGRGIGSGVIRSLMERAQASGKPLTLRVLHVNKRARELYERLGFEPFEEIETHTFLRWSGQVLD